MKLVKSNMKPQKRHNDILAWQFENTSLSTGDNEKVSCLRFHRWFYKFITEIGAKMNYFAIFDDFATLGQHITILKRNRDIFSDAHLNLPE